MRKIAFVQTTLLTAGLLVAAAPAAPAADECLQTPTVGGYYAGDIPDLRSTPAPVKMSIGWSGDWYPPDYCSGVTATVQKSDGSLRQSIAFDEHGGSGMPPFTALLATLTVPVANGAGDWVVTRMTHGTASIAVSVPFRVRRATTATIEQPARVTSPTKTTVTGVVRQYTSTGATAAGAGRTVRLYGGGAQGGTVHQLGTGRTDSAGRYRFQVAISAPVIFHVTVDPTTAYGAQQTGDVTARLLASVALTTPSTRGYIGVWWRAPGKAFPTNVFTFLDIFNGSTWTPTNSFGYPAADGTFTRWWKPTTAGTYRLRMTVNSGGPDNLPVVREYAPVTVTARPASISGTAGATSAVVIRPGTKMSTFGHLDAMYTTGATGPFAGQQVVVQTRPRGTTLPYATVATATTNSTGYYYTNWTIQSDVDVRVAFLSPYTSVGSAFTYVRAFDVQ